MNGPKATTPLLTGSQKPYTLPLQSAFWTMPVIDIRTPRKTMPGARRRRSRPPMPRARPRSMRPSPAKHARPTQVFGGLMDSGWLTLPETRMEARRSGLGTQGFACPERARRQFASRRGIRLPDSRQRVEQVVLLEELMRRRAPAANRAALERDQLDTHRQRHEHQSQQDRPVHAPPLARHLLARKAPRARGGAHDDERPARPVVDGPERQRAPRDDEQNQPTHGCSRDGCCRSRGASLA